MGQHSKLYKLKAWVKILRPIQLAKQPLCVFCQRKGITTPATIVDHIKPHRGDLDLFLDKDNLQSLCKACHDGEKQIEEANGHSTTIGDDGWPVDDLHPFYTGAKR